MAMRYLDRLKSKKGKEGNPSKKPVLNDEDEKFLEKLTSEETAPPLPARPTVILDNGKELKGKDAQMALMDGADKVPLPTSPPAADTSEEKKKKDYWSYLPSIPGVKGKKKQKAADHAAKASEGAAVQPDANVAAGETQKQEEADLSSILDQLNLSAVNNRVFSFSKESQELLEKFKLVLKDLVNGVPTAYDDLENLLTNSEGQLQKLYGGLPPFLQTLVKSLPSKMTAAIGPELLAAAAEKPSANVSSLEAGPSKEGKKSKRARVPSLKSLVTQQGAVAGMLRSILNFLKLRFPAVLTGTNVLMSLAVFLLLFVFWYCHKRGRETRLERSKNATDASVSDLDRSSSELEDSTFTDNPGDQPGGSEPPITINPGSGVDDKPSASVADMPSVLDLPDPTTVPLPAEKIQLEK